MIGALATLLLGHVLADFVFQSRRLAEAKRQQHRGLLTHIAIVALSHAACLAPSTILEPRGAAHWLWLVPALAVVHGLIDAAKIAIERRVGGERLSTFLGNQAMHAVTLFAAAAIGPSVRVPPLLFDVIVLTIAFVLVTIAGSAVVRLVLARHPLPANAKDDDANANEDRSRPDAIRMGHTIGILERSLGPAN
ncbi:MAG: DUF3307 domain-containing protein [bacterium]|nr:DUF3307 domain-containing protein [bacterium]